MTQKYTVIARSSTHGTDIVAAVREMHAINGQACGPAASVYRVFERFGCTVLMECPFDCTEIADAEAEIERQDEAHRKHLQNIGVLKTDAELAAIRAADERNKGHGLWLHGKRDFEQPGFQRHNLDDVVP